MGSMGRPWRVQTTQVSSKSISVPKRPELRGGGEGGRVQAEHEGGGRKGWEGVVWKGEVARAGSRRESGISRRTRVHKRVQPRTEKGWKRVPRSGSANRRQLLSAPP